MKRYFTESDMPNLIFYRVPKVLILSERYAKMKPNALKMYMVLLDRLQLSMQNRWVDEKGYYVRMSKEQGSKLLNISEPTFISAKKELRKFGLIEEKRIGLNKANLIYVLKVDYTEEDLYKIQQENTDLIEEGRKLKNLTSGDKTIEPQEVKEFNSNDNNIKENNNNNNFNCNYKKSLSADIFRELLTNSCNESYPVYSVGRWSKKEWNTLINKFVDDTIISGRYKYIPEDKIKGYTYKCLETMANNSDYKRSEEFSDYQQVMSEMAQINSSLKTNKQSSSLFNWLEN